MMKLFRKRLDHHFLSKNDPPLRKEFRVTIKIAIMDSVSFPISVYYLDSVTEGSSLPEEVVVYLSENNYHYNCLLRHTKAKSILVENAYPSTGYKNVMQFKALLAYGMNIVAESKTAALEKVGAEYQSSNIHQYVEAIKTHDNHIDVSVEFVDEQPNEIFLSEFLVT